MTRKGFYINERDCINCHACEVACSDWNDLRWEEWTGTLGEPEYPNVKWIDVLEIFEGDYRDPDVTTLALPCGHCENAPCIDAAPEYAMGTRDEDNLVFIAQENLEEGDTQAIVDACPFDRIQVPEEDMPATSGYPDGKAAGLPTKCTGCFDRDEPACAQACPTLAIEFGDFEELQAEHPDADRSLLREIFGDEAVDEADPAIIIED